MKFLKLIIENYKSFQEKTTIRFPTGNDERSIFLIGGMNGAGKTSIMEAINFCLYGTKSDEIFRCINRREKARGNTEVAFELAIRMDDDSELLVKRSWSSKASTNPKPRDLAERLVVIRDGMKVSVHNRDLWHNYIRTVIPPGITQFFFFDGEKIQSIAADDHSEVRLKSSLEAALGIQYINRLIADLTYVKNEERKGFVEISDEDMAFKESELKKESSKQKRLQREIESIKEELRAFRVQHDETRARFKAAFHTDPETREARREVEKKRNLASNRLIQVESEIRTLCEKVLPFALAGRLFDEIRRQIDVERDSADTQIIRQHAANLANRIVRAVEEPEPIYSEKLSSEKMAELEQRIFRLLQNIDQSKAVNKVLDISDRDAARVLNKMETLEESNLFSLKLLFEERRALKDQITQADKLSESGWHSQAEQELFDQLQVEIEGCLTQIGRKTEKLRRLEESFLEHSKRMSSIQMEIEKLYEKYHISKDRFIFIQECDAICNTLNNFIVKLRKNKINLLQERTFEMYRRLSSRSDLIKDIVIDDKTYEVRITDRNGHEIRKSGLSAGEKEVFAISMLWGLAQTSQIKLPIIIDTPLSRLDSTHRDNIVSNYFPNAGEQVIILSTDTEIDKNYYRSLKPHLKGAGSLVFDKKRELTIFREGYFWEN